MRSDQADRIDVIGDVHGCRGALQILIHDLGYRKLNGRWSHTDRRTIVFVGDYIDGGTDPVGVLRLVRELCEDEIAVALLGNHDLNAIAFCLDERLISISAENAHADGLRRLSVRDTIAVARTETPPPETWRRPHEHKNLGQHRLTLERTTSREYAELIDWLRRRPMFLDLPCLRAVHAAWHEASLRRAADWTIAAGVGSLGITAVSMKDAIALQHAMPGLSDQQWSELLLPSGLDASAYDYASTERVDVAVERLLKGIEVRLPESMQFTDHSGHQRNQMRIKWYEGAEGRTFGQHALMSDVSDALSMRIERRYRGQIPWEASEGYPSKAPPVFFGHYALPSTFVRPLGPNVCCVDFGVHKDPAMGGGTLACYRWSGERVLRPENFVTVSAH